MGSSPQFSLPLLPGPEVAPIPTPLASLSSGSHRQTRIIISREGVWILSPLPRLPVSTPSLGQLQLVWDLEGHGRL